MADLDTTLPTLTGLTLPTIDVTGAIQTATFAASATDAGSGVDHVALLFDHTFQTQYGISPWLEFLDSADSFSDGVSQQDLTFATPTGAGTYNVLSAIVFDKAGNSTVYSTSDLISLGIASSFQVKSGSVADVTAPTLTGLTLPTIDVTTPNLTATFAASAKDAGSGVDYVILQFDHSIQTQSGAVSSFTFSDNADSFSDGVSGSDVTLLTSAAVGTYTVTSAVVYDKAGNYAVYSTGDLAGLGIASSFQIVDHTAVTAFADPGAPVIANFNVANGWSSQDSFPRHVVDVNGDGYADIVGFGINGVLVSNGSADGSYSGAALAVTDFGANQGWTSDNVYHRELADVNGDGKADIVGFGIAGVYVSLATSSGFASPSLTVQNFNPANGWSSQDGFTRTLADVNGDGAADIVGFGIAGTYVALGQGDGTFEAPKLAMTDFGSDQGWSSDNVYHRELGDVNGDGRADIVGFGTAGVYVALGQADGTFGSAALQLDNLNPANGWSSQDAYTRTLADVNGDGKADIVGFGQNGVFVAYATDDGHFTTPTLDIANFSQAQGWTSDNIFHREIADLNHDGLADIVGFGIGGVMTALKYSNVIA